VPVTPGRGLGTRHALGKTLRKSPESTFNSAFAPELLIIGVMQMNLICDDTVNINGRALELHTPVMVKEVLKCLSPVPGGLYADCTAGTGGHSEAILEATAGKARLICMEWDRASLDICRLRLKDYSDSCTFVCDSYANLRDVVRRLACGPLDGILLDLGVSSFQLRDSSRGFSFSREGPLDMRMSDITGVTAESVVNDEPRERIEEILRTFGEERSARRISFAIEKARKQGRITSTLELANIIERAKGWRGRLNPATQSFQALRIAVNNELDNATGFFSDCESLLKPGGVIGVISFHSLEDRIVKNAIASKARQGLLSLLMKKPIPVSGEERSDNPQSRSAKLRAARRI
jgi:16S rRNA (cytosine1402-N4)-methyltransferase